MVNINTKLQEIAESKEIFLMSEKVGELMGLHIDQVGELDRHIRKILLREAKSENFIKEIAEILEIDEEKAKKIAETVNVEVFEVIKKQIKESEEVQKESRISSVEKAGDFKIERSDTEVPVTPINQDHALNELENHLEEEKNSALYPPIHAEPLMDHLLYNAVSHNEFDKPSKRPAKKINWDNIEPVKPVEPVEPTRYQKISEEFRKDSFAPTESPRIEPIKEIKTDEKPLIDIPNYIQNPIIEHKSAIPEPPIDLPVVEEEKKGAPKTQSGGSPDLYREPIK